MLSLDGTQQAIVDADNKDEVSWLFEVDRNGNGTVDYYWSTKAKTWSAQAYTFKVTDFSPISMKRNRSEDGIITPGEFSFTITNKDNALSPGDFSGGNVTVKLVIKAGADEAVIRTWNFDFVGIPEAAEQTLVFRCRDWLQKYLEGSWSNTPLIHYLFPRKYAADGGGKKSRFNVTVEASNACVPVILGKPTIPITPIINQKITNGSMEKNANWTAVGTPVICQQSSAQAHGGTYSWYVSADTAGDGVKGATFPTNNGYLYNVVFWVYSAEAHAWDVKVRKGDNSGWITATGLFVTRPNTWTRFERRFLEGAASEGPGAYVQFEAHEDGARDIYIDDVSIIERFYLVGPDTPTYTYHDVRNLPPFGSQRYKWWDYNAKEKNLTGTDGNSYHVMQVILTDADGDGISDSNLVYREGDRYLPIGLQYTRDDTSGITNPGDALDYILQDFGIPAARIDATTLATVKSTYSGWGLTWNAGFWFQEPREEILARLLVMCHTELIIRDKIYFKVHSKTSQKTITKAHVQSQEEKGPSSFEYHSIQLPELSDSGYVAFEDGDGCLSNLMSWPVSVKGVYDHRSDAVVRADYVQNSQNAQRIGTLALQRKFLPMADASFLGKGILLALEPDDVITPSHADYGGTYQVLIDSIEFGRDLDVAIEATRFKEALDDWGDLAPSAVSLPDDDDSCSVYEVMVSGPDGLGDSGNPMCNVIPGRFRIGQTGNYILFDPSRPIQHFVEGGVVRMKIGDLGTEDYGIEFLDHAGISILKLDGAGGNLLSGWSLSEHKFTCQSGQVGLNAEVTEDTDWRIWAGHATPGSAPFRVDEAGNLYCSLIHAIGGTIGGWTVGATTLASENITLDSDNDKITVNGITIDGANNRIRSANYVSGYMGAGFTLEPDLLEVGNAAIRGIIRTAVFQKDIISAVGGNLAVIPSDVLAADMTAEDASTLTIEGNETFAVGDLLRIKDAADDEWMQVTNIAAAPIYMVTRDKADSYGADANPAWKKGAAVVNYLRAGQSFIYITASEINAPYLALITHAGSPWTSLTTRFRVGNLNGYLGYSADIYGIGIGSSATGKANLTFDPTNGIRLRIATADKIVLDNAGNVYIAGTVRIGGSGAVLASSIDGWKHAIDATKIDGGKIYTNTIIAAQIKGADFGTLTITSGKIAINTADALEIQAAGNIKVLAGGDIIMNQGDADPALIKWGTVHNFGAGFIASRGLCLWPTTSDQDYFYIGYDPVNEVVKRYKYFYAYANRIYFNATQDATHYAEIYLYTAAAAGWVQLRARSGGDHIQVTLDGGALAFYPTGNLISLGKVGAKWVDGFFAGNLVVDGVVRIGGVGSAKVNIHSATNTNPILIYEDTDDSITHNFIVDANDGGSIGLYANGGICTILLVGAAGTGNFTGCVADGTCEIFTEDALVVIADIMRTGSGKFDEFGHEHFDMRKLFKKYPYLIMQSEMEIEDSKKGPRYFDRLGAKSDLLYRATMQLKEQNDFLKCEITRLEGLISKISRNDRLGS